MVFLASESHGEDKPNTIRIVESNRSCRQNYNTIQQEEMLNARKELQSLPLGNLIHIIVIWSKSIAIIIVLMDMGYVQLLFKGLSNTCSLDLWDPGGNNVDGMMQESRLHETKCHQLLVSRYIGEIQVTTIM